MAEKIEEKEGNLVLFLWFILFGLSRKENSPFKASSFIRFIGWWSLFLGSHIIYFVFLHFSCNQIDIFECSVESEGLFSFHVYWFCLIHVWLRRNL